MYYQKNLSEKGALHIFGMIAMVFILLIGLFLAELYTHSKNQDLTISQLYSTQQKLDKRIEVLEKIALQGKGL